MCRGVVGFDSRSQRSIDCCFYLVTRGKLSLYHNDMVQMMTLCFGGIANFKLRTVREDISRIADLTAAFAVERCPIKDYNRAITGGNSRSRIPVYKQPSDLRCRLNVAIP